MLMLNRWGVRCKNFSGWELGGGKWEEGRNGNEEEWLCRGDRTILETGS